MPAELVETHESLLAFRTSRRDLLVVPSLERVAQSGQGLLTRFEGIVRVMRLVVHLHGLWVLEGFVTPFMLTSERASVLNHVYGYHCRLDNVL